jgi:hypothetical protein
MPGTKRQGAVVDFEFDIFLSHNGRDKPNVRELKRLQSEADIKAWLGQFKR